MRRLRRVGSLGLKAAALATLVLLCVVGYILSGKNGNKEVRHTREAELALLKQRSQTDIRSTARLTSLQRSIVNVLPKPRRILRDDLISVTDRYNQEIVLGNGTFAVVTLSYYAPLKRLVALKTVKFEKRLNQEYGATLFIEAGVSNYLANSGGFAPICYGVIDEFTAIFELLLLPAESSTTLTKVEVFAAGNKQLLPSLLSPDLFSIFRQKQRTQHFVKIDWLLALCQVAQSVSLLHRIGLIHRDIKLDNVLLSWHLLPTENGNIVTDRQQRRPTVVTGLLSDFGSTRLRNPAVGAFQKAYDVRTLGDVFRFVQRHLLTANGGDLTALIDDMTRKQPTDRITIIDVRDQLLRMLQTSQLKSKCLSSSNGNDDQKTTVLLVP